MSLEADCTDFTTDQSLHQYAFRSKLVRDKQAKSIIDKDYL